LADSPFNPYFDVSVEEGKRLADEKKASVKESEKVVPFGKMVPRNTDEWRDRIISNNDFRRSELTKMGHKEFLKKWKGRK